MLKRWKGNKKVPSNFPRSSNATSIWKKKANILLTELKINKTGGNNLKIEKCYENTSHLNFWKLFEIFSEAQAKPKVKFIDNVKHLSSKLETLTLILPGKFIIFYIVSQKKYRRDITGWERWSTGNFNFQVSSSGHFKFWTWPVTIMDRKILDKQHFLLKKNLSLKLRLVEKSQN